MLLPKNAQQVLINGPVGVLDTLILHPQEPVQGLALIFHPDPKGGGTYTNKVVQTIAKVLANKNYLVYCPNLRGVGLSAGVHNFGVGEIEDAYAIFEYARAAHSNMPIILGGFSFGSSIAAQLAHSVEHKQLLLVGPAVTRYSIRIPAATKTLVIHGQDDEIIPLDEIYIWAAQQGVPISVFTKTGHFFHGKIAQLQAYLMQVIHG